MPQKTTTFQMGLLWQKGHLTALGGDGRNSNGSHRKGREGREGSPVNGYMVELGELQVLEAKERRPSSAFWPLEQPSGSGHMKKSSSHGLSHLTPVLCAPSAPKRLKRLTFRAIYLTQCDFRGLSVILKCQAPIFNKNIIFDLRLKSKLIQYLSLTLK